MMIDLAFKHPEAWLHNGRSTSSRMALHQLLCHVAGLQVAFLRTASQLSILGQLAQIVGPYSNIFDIAGPGAA